MEEGSISPDPMVLYGGGLYLSSPRPSPPSTMGFGEIQSTAIRLPLPVILSPYEIRKKIPLFHFHRLRLSLGMIFH